MSAAAITGFSADELLPTTGSSIERDGQAMATKVAMALAASGTIYIPNPLHRPVFQAVEQVRQQGIASPLGHRSYALLVLGPSAAGKTTVIEQAIDHALRTDAANGRSAEAGSSVLYIPINVGMTNRALWSAMLMAMGDTFRERSSEEMLRVRVYARMRSKGITLVVFDEIQHLARSGNARDVTDVLKRMLDDGVVPLVLVGIDDAWRMFQKNLQIGNRMVAPASLAPLDYRNTTDVELFERFLMSLDNALLKKGLTERLSGFGEKRLVMAIMLVSDGMLGRAVNLIRQALVIATRREAAFIEIHDLAQATIRWAIPLKICTANPFVAQPERTQ